MRAIRSLIALAATVCGLTGQGQPPASLSLDLGGGRALVTDVVERADGGFLLAVMSIDPAGGTESWICSAGPTLALEAIHSLDQMDGSFLLVSEILEMPDSSMVSVGAVWGGNPWGELRMVLHGVDADGSNSLLQAMPIGGDTLRPFSMSSVVDDDGDIFIVGTMQVSSVDLPNQFLMMRARPAIGEVASTLLKHGGSLGITRHALPDAGGLVRVSMDGSLRNVVQGIATFHRFDHDLEYQDGFALSSLGGSSSTFMADSIPHDGGYMTALAGDTLIVSGRFGFITGAGMRAALVRVSGDGTYAGMFLPRSTYQHDCTPLTQGHDRTVDGRVLFAVTENFDPYPPDPHVGNFPTRSHVYVLDTLLNPECEYIVDGFDGNVCYYLNRIKATRDGGFLLMGSRRDLNTMEQPRAWIMKVDGSQCSPMGLTEETRPDPTMVYPNPGRDGFTLVLNGTHRGNMRLELYDAMGQLAIARPITQSMEFIDTEHLPPGMYLYRVSAAGGALLGGGRWVKQ